GIRDLIVTGVQTCALPISPDEWHLDIRGGESLNLSDQVVTTLDLGPVVAGETLNLKFDIVSDYQHGAATVWRNGFLVYSDRDRQIGRASCRERVELNIEGL